MHQLIIKYTQWPEKYSFPQDLQYSILAMTTTIQPSVARCSKNRDGGTRRLTAMLCSMKTFSPSWSWPVQLSSNPTYSVLIDYLGYLHYRRVPALWRPCTQDNFSLCIRLHQLFSKECIWDIGDSLRLRYLLSNSQNTCGQNYIAMTKNWVPLSAAERCFSSLVLSFQGFFPQLNIPFAGINGSHVVHLSVSRVLQC